MKSTINIAEILGNRDFLRLNKTAFLCSRKIPASAVLKCYDWAIEQREKGICVISGFHSQLEKDVFHYLAKGDQPIILALPRGLKIRWEPEIKNLLKKDRLLIITPFASRVKRVTKETASVRNHLMVDVADDIVIGYKDPNGNLEALIKSIDKSKQMNRNIELIHYRRFGEDLLLLELVNVAEAKNGGSNAVSSGPAKSKQEYKTVTEHLKSANQELTDLYHALRDYMMNLGDDVQEKTLKYYFAYKRIKNFACVEVHPQSQKLYVYVKLNPDEVNLEEDFTRDVRYVGHYGTGDLEITIRNQEDLAKAEPLILRSYEGS